MGGLRGRILLLFAVMLIVTLAAAALSLRIAGTEGSLTGFVALAFLLLAVLTAAWFVLDQAVAQAVDRLAAALRVHAHNDAAPPLDGGIAGHLGDLGDAAEVVTRELDRARRRTADLIASETRALCAERARLTDILTEIPVATILAGDNHTIALYDGQAAEVLAQIGTPRLNAPLSDYFTEDSLARARRQMHKTGLGIVATLDGVHGALSLTARMKPMRQGGYLILIDAADATIAPDADRPLVYDFDLLTRRETAALENRRLHDMTFCVFDLETTGLLPHRDAVLQIGALRVMNGRVLAGERFDLVVDPGRPIPPASTKVHHITDAMVRGQPDILEAAPRFHDFARDTVLVAHNAPFDLAFLKAKQTETGLDWTHPVIDTVLLSAILFGTTETHTLDAVCTRLGITIPAELRHTALGDAHATAEALCRMLPMLEGRGIDTFGAYLDAARRHGRLIQDMN
ncbi:DNA polymerase-3 subunit epsilon [Roseivivax lentus]|uniref:DNA-directed DNA polymerase n=1 Tax=Roseivivax lentus TaxID=633194 RepID=A0A1N7Q3J1_9RHOB|nr:exonuclease domain-containing protein [Roseivivax lentus]SIT17391.1 DNA polymerase-3 subunit epsilon [Roseivivax lentus]